MDEVAQKPLALDMMTLDNAPRQQGDVAVTGEKRGRERQKGSGREEGERR